MRKSLSYKINGIKKKTPPLVFKNNIEILPEKYLNTMYDALKNITEF